MKILIESDREVTVDGVGLVSPETGPVEIDSQVFEMYHGCKPAEANFPLFVKITVDLEGGD